MGQYNQIQNVFIYRKKAPPTITAPKEHKITLTRETEHNSYGQPTS